MRPDLVRPVDVVLADLAVGIGQDHVDGFIDVIRWGTAREHGRDETLIQVIKLCRRSEPLERGVSRPWLLS
jgi:hypothetical protein